MRIFFSLFFAVFFTSNCLAQTRGNVLNPALEPRGAPELVVCSQNLANYGLIDDVKRRDPNMDPYKLLMKEKGLVRRFIAAGCDVIAVQEILGKGVEGGQKALAELAKTLRTETNRIFDLKVGESNDPMSRVGFLVAKDRAEIVNSNTYFNIELPKISEKQKPRDFSRGPLEVQIRVKGRDGSNNKTVALITDHFKSKRGGADDPAALEWETHRMEMAEAVRRIIASRHKAAFASGQSLFILLGDRNSNFDAASAKILEGTLTLKDFQEKAPCRLSKRGIPLCQAGIAKPQRLFSALLGDPQTKLLPGTFRMDDIYSWLDDIMMPGESMRFAWKDYDVSGDYNTGVIYGPKEASDHALVYVVLNW